MPTHRSLPDPSGPDPLADLGAAAAPVLPGDAADASSDEVDEVDAPARNRALVVSYWLLALAFLSTFLTAVVWSSWEGVLAQGLATVLLWAAYWVAALVASS